MSNFEFPTNIRQIGSIDEGLRIYVEDYVCSYLQQYAQAGGYDERLAALIGRYMTIDSQPVLFISGAVQGKYCVEEDGLMVFSEKSREYILDQKERYFPSLDIVGWMQSQPSYGTYLNAGYHTYHLENYKNPHDVLFVIDPIERLNSFYLFDEEKNELAESRGYFIYYEKNRNMHEYMLDNRVTRGKDVFINEDMADEEEGLEEPVALEKDKLIDKTKSRRVVAAARRNPSEGEIRMRQGVRGRKSTTEQKRTVNMLVSLSGVLFLICFIMGAGLLRSEERIGQLEENLTALNVAYRNLIASSQTESVFAPQTDGEVPEAVDSSGIVYIEDGNQLLSENNTGQTAPEQTNPPAQDSPPASASGQDSSSSTIPDTYTVQEGDSLIGISQRFYGTNAMVDKIMELNDIDDPDKIYFGKILALPKN